MIINKVLKVKKTDNLTSEYIENELATFGYDVIRWVITSVEDDDYILNVSIVKD